MNLALGTEFDVEQSMNLLKQSLEMLCTGVLLCTGIAVFHATIFIFFMCSKYSLSFANQSQRHHYLTLYKSTFSSSIRKCN